LVRGALRDGLDPPNRNTDRGSSAVPIVTIQQGPRDAELKRELVKRVTDAFVDAYRIPADSWGAAGKLTADK
jgi:4-oxalocrotonate tautomerase